MLAKLKAPATVLRPLMACVTVYSFCACRMNASVTKLYQT